MCIMNAKNPRVFLDFQIGNQFVGQVTIELFANLVPKTAENFRGLCTGEYGSGLETNQPLCYAGCKILKIIPGQYIRCGDFSKNDGSGGESIYGGKFKDENFNLWHANAGVVSMYSEGKNGNGSQFLITLKKVAQLNRRHVVFGQVRCGMHILRAIERLPIDMQDRPRVPIFIVGCGQTRKSRGSTGGSSSAAERGKKLLRTLALHQDPADIKETTEKPRSTKFDHLPEAVAAFLVAGNIDEEAAVRANTDTKAPAVASDSESEESQWEEEKEDDAVSWEDDSSPLNNSEVMFELNNREDCRSKWEILKDRISEECEKNERESQPQESDSDDDTARRKSRGRWSDNPKWYLNDTLAQVKAKNALEVKKQRNISFGWNVWNQRSVYQNYEKQLSQMKSVSADTTRYSGMAKPTEGEDFVPTSEGRKRLAMLLSEKKKAKRHRSDVELGDVNYVNRQNRKFNKRLEKAYGAYTLEIKQNLERGTAL